MDLKATPLKESSTTCECCGKISRIICGEVSVGDKTLTIYYVQWIVDATEHQPNIDLVLGPWGADADPGERVLISLAYDARPGGGGFTLIDSETRPANSRALCGRALKREEVIGTLFAQEAFQLVDAIWLHDPRILELKSLDNQR
ncbi:MAG: hypothetical protein Q8S00_24420 [Deltaproteobacteria bacterium]|nr:hypothetical protein [Deltaproteobacteria bacterium]MDZ4343358.1 hypothetical protein [Candidatus Binatia bacterium]